MCLGEEQKGSYQLQRCWATNFRGFMPNISNPSFSLLEWRVLGETASSCSWSFFSRPDSTHCVCPFHGVCFWILSLVWGFFLLLGALLDFGVNTWCHSHVSSLDWCRWYQIPLLSPERSKSFQPLHFNLHLPSLNFIWHNLILSPAAAPQFYLGLPEVNHCDIGEEKALLWTLSRQWGTLCPKLVSAGSGYGSLLQPRMNQSCESTGSLRSQHPIFLANAQPCLLTSPGSGGSIRSCMILRKIQCCSSDRWWSLPGPHHQMASNSLVINGPQNMLAVSATIK